MQLNSSSLVSDKRIEHAAAAAVGSIAAAVILVKTALALVRSINGENGNLPMVPYKLPFIGSTFLYYKNPLLFAKYTTEKYGSVFRMHLHGDITTIVGAKDAPEVFNNPHLSFVASQNKFFNSALFDGPGEPTLPDRILKHVAIKHLTPNLKDYSPRGFQQFLLEANEKASENEFTVPNLMPFVRRFVSKYSASAFLGPRMSQDEDLINVFENTVADFGKEFRPGPLRVISPWFNSLYLNYFVPRSGIIKKYRTVIRNSLEREIIKRSTEESLKEADVKDVLDYLLKTFPHEMDDNHLESLTTIFLIFVFVGIHTTTETLTYVMYCLVKFPEYIPELRQEQQQVVLAEGADYSSQDLVYTPAMYRRMEKLDSFIRECMRTRMVGIGLSHTNTSDKDIILKSGAIVEPGHEVFINLFHVHNDQENNVGFDNLDTFDGFRFVGKDKLAVKSGPDHVTFGMGRHSCPGRWFAIHQIKGIVSYFVKNYDLSAHTEVRIQNSTLVDCKYTGKPAGAVRFTKIQ